MRKYIELREKGKITSNCFKNAYHEYIFVKHGFTPTLTELLQYYPITSQWGLELTLKRIQKAGASYIKKRKTSRANRKRRELLIMASDDGTITPEFLAAKLLEQENRCATCKADITERSSRHMDHIHPVSKGGAHSATNIQWLCVRCNVTKHDKILWHTPAVAH